MGEIPPSLKIMGTTQLGSDRGEGNILAIQPWMLAQDYADEKTFHIKLEGYFEAAKNQNLIGNRTLIVLPEFIGTWLVGLGEKVDVFDAPDLGSAMRKIVLGNLWRFILTLPHVRNQSTVKDAIFRMKSGIMARTYQSVCSSLAKKYQVTLVAGTIVLPEPTIQGHEIRPGKGLIYNAGFVFRKDGSLYEQVVRKAFPIPDEQGFVAPASVEDVPVFETELGRLGVLICADSWYPQSYRVMTEKRADIIVVPSFLTGSRIWDQPWGGYETGKTPEDVQDQPRALTEGEAWHKYAIKARLKASVAKTAVNVFLKGNFWDLAADGRTLGMHNEEVIEASGQEGAEFVNVWL